MINYIILGFELLIFLWVMSWAFTSQVMKIYALLQLEKNKNTGRALHTVGDLQWEIFTFLGCFAILFYVLQRLLFSPAVFALQS